MFLFLHWLIGSSVKNSQLIFIKFTAHQCKSITFIPYFPFTHSPNLLKNKQKQKNYNSVNSKYCLLDILISWPILISPILD